MAQALFERYGPEDVRAESAGSDPAQRVWPEVVEVSLVFALIIMVMIYATGHLSGAHVNPAVTIAFTLTRHFSLRDAVAYIAAQLTGATLAALVLLGIWPASRRVWARRCRPSRPAARFSTR